ncbi:biotin transporter BioY [Conchiformibius kuhniae]|uniref:Biotin transporter n=1 Tax=Conchiformibius kuhniae TaxID=211502 RepID=A0A8T9MT28_9NEIS|nr:biotin transporter BioY [Conchiformibius kuhniae]UOP04421.1 biotin transporter BioY [Conchiformibius kuhniae]
MYAQLSATKKWAVQNPVQTFLLQTLIGANVIALLAQLAIPLPFVSITGQSLGVTVIGFALGRKAGTAAVLLYLLEGAMGFPVFANGKAGLAVLMGPSGGYLFGFVAMAWILGYFSDKGVLRSLGKSIAVAVLANAVMYALGLAQLSLFVPADKVLAVGLYPFIIGDLIKACIAAAAVAPAYRFFQKL